jgi:hypothetical protein
MSHKFKEKGFKKGLKLLLWGRGRVKRGVLEGDSVRAGEPPIQIYERAARGTKRHKPLFF